MKLFFYLTLICASLFIICKNNYTNAHEGFQESLLELHNEKRLVHGLRPLVLNKQLCEYAQRHANKMASKSHMYHSDISRVGQIDPSKNWDWVGENVAWGQKTPQDVVNEWMWSPGHRWNILGSKFTQVGFGLAQDSKGTNYWCAVFAN